MYDYRQDVINLMNNTQNSEESLRQSAQALQMLLNMVNQKPAAPMTPTAMVQSSESAADVPEKPKDAHKVKIIKKADKSSDWPDGMYQIVRKLRGAVARNQFHKDCAYFNEETVHDFGLENGDFVALNIREPYNPNVHQNGQAFITDHVKHNEPDSIATFGPALVKESNGKKIITEDSQGTHLYDAAGIISYEVPEELEWIEPGDLVKLAWYKNSPETMTIRWKYNTDRKESPRHIIH